MLDNFRSFVSKLKVNIYFLIIAYSMFVYLIMENQHTLISFVLHTLLATITACVLCLLIMHFNSFPQTKENILIFTTKLLIYTLIPPLLRFVVIHILHFLYKDLVVDGFTNNFGVACTMWNPIFTHSAYYNAQTLILIWKIVLISRPVTFLSLNTVTIKRLSVFFLFLPNIVLVISIFKHDHICPARHIKAVVEKQFNIELDIDKTLVDSLKSGAVGYPLLFCVVLLCEMFTKFVVYLKERRKRKRRQIRVVPSISASVEPQNSGHTSIGQISHQPSANRMEQLPAVEIPNHTEIRQRR